MSVGRTLASIGIPRSTFYDWYGRYQDGGIEALEDGRPRPQRVWNKIPDEIGAAIVNLALDEPDLSPRELAVNFTDTKASFVSELQLALKASGLDQVNVLHRPRLLSDNGPSYVSSELGDWLKDKGIRHVRGRPYHPMTQGKIERYHRSMKNRILLENYYLPGQLELSIGEFVEYYNNQRYHESLDNLTPVDVYFGRGPAILKWRESIKRKTIEQRRRLHQHAIAA